MIVGAIAVVDVTSTVVDWAAINDRGHSVHLVTAKEWRLNTRLADAVQINRFNLLRCPIRPEIVIVSDRKSERISELVSNDAWLFRVSIET